MPSLIWTSKQLKPKAKRIWLEYTPPLAPDEEDDAAPMAEQRFERFLDLVRNGGPGAGV